METSKEINRIIEQLRNAAIMRDEARKIFDMEEEDDEDKAAFLHQFLESESWRK